MDFLNIDVTAAQKSIIRPTERDLNIGTILRESGGERSRTSMPSRRINTMGEINNHCTVANSTSRIAKLQSAMELAKSIDQVKKMSAALKEDKQQQAMSELTGSFEEAEAALDDKGDISQCKIQHIPHSLVVLGQVA